MLKFTLLFAVALLVVAPGASAQTLDISLNVLYTDVNNAGSGGTWQLVGKSSGFGIASVIVPVTGIPAPSVVNRAPLGVVNGNDPAGFYVFQAATNPLGYVSIFAGQAPLLPGAGEEEALFYGVGTTPNGQPGAVGPAFSSLTNVQNTPWATGDVLLNPAWNNAAILASGTFLPGANPGLFSSGDTKSLGSIFTSLGSSSSAGDISSNPTVTAIVRRNLAVILGGDYNDNGIVDAADYTVWRDTLGLTVPVGTGADGDGDGTIGSGDYTVWKSNFGVILGSGGGSGAAGSASAAVPEPATCVLLASAMLTLLGRRRRS